MTHYYDTFETPIGAFSVAIDAAGAVIATAMGGRDRLQTRFDSDQLERSEERIRQIREQIIEFFAGKRHRFDLKLAPAGTHFQQEVWNALLRIPYGQTRSYGEVANEIGHPGAARAVGRANGTNPICLIIPCHRVIGADGSLTGFAYGEEIKRQLLELESGPTKSKSQSPSPKSKAKRNSSGADQSELHLI